MSALTGKHVLVLGLGESGLAMARWCALRGARVRVADSRATPPGLDALREDAPLAEIVTGEFGPAVLDGIDLVALSPGLDPRVGVAAEARRRGLPITGEMSLLAQALERGGDRLARHARGDRIAGAHCRQRLGTSLGMTNAAPRNSTPQSSDRCQISPLRAAAPASPDRC